MAKKTSSEQTQTAEDISSTEVTATADVAAPAKKPRAPRKKAAVSAETKPKKPAVKRTRRTKAEAGDASAPVMKAYWGVFNPTMVQIAQYDYAEEAEAQKVAADMTEKKKAPHFVQLIKKVV